MDYAGNSNKGKAQADPPIEEKKIEKVVTGKVVMKKKGLGYKFKSIFFGGDAKSTAAFLAADVLLPAARDIVFQAATEGTRSMVYGQGRGRTVKPEMRSNIQYNNVTKLRPDSIHLPGQPPRTVQRLNRREANDILITDRSEAERVLELMIDIVDKYNVVSLADLYEMLGQPAAHVDRKWGWTNLAHSSVRQVREGYLLELPSMEEI